MIVWILVTNYVVFNIKNVIALRLKKSLSMYVSDFSQLVFIYSFIKVYSTEFLYYLILSI